MFLCLSSKVLMVLYLDHELEVKKRRAMSCRYR